MNYRSIYIKGTKPIWTTVYLPPVLSWIIRIFTWSDVSHVLTEFPNQMEIFHVYLTQRKFQSTPTFLNPNTVKVEHTFEVVISTDKVREMREYMETQVGKQPGYYIQLLGIIPSLFFRLINIKISNPFAKIYGNSVTCAEVISKTFKEVLQVDWFDAIPLNTITERDIIEILEANRGNHGNVKVRRIQ